MIKYFEHDILRLQFVITYFSFINLKLLEYW